MFYKDQPNENFVIHRYKSWKIKIDNENRGRPLTPKCSLILANIYFQI